MRVYGITSVVISILLRESEGPARMRGAKGKKVNSGTGIVRVFQFVVAAEHCRRQVTDRFKCRRVVSVSSALTRDNLVSAV